MNDETLAAPPTDPFVHLALLYNGAADYLSGTVPFVLDALAADEPVAVAVPPENLALISGELGRDANRVRFVNMPEAGRNPGRIIPGVLNAFAAEHAGRPFRIIGEPIWAGRSGAEYPACLQHESLINLAFTGREGSVLCPYDAASLDPGWMVDAERSHPALVRAGLTWPSYRYVEPADLIPHITALPDPPPGAAELVFCAGLKVVREFVREQALRMALPAERLDDVLVAVNEVATNAVLHTAGAGTLRMWTDSTHLICEVRDHGHLTDLLAGRLPVPLDSPHGRGLLLVNHLCDLVRIDTEAGRTTTRMYFRC
jgi:anti-sigma regulatory factor (Ser/Thr protein kinase)